MLNPTYRCLVCLLILSALLISCSLRKYVGPAPSDFNNPHTDCAHCHGIPNPKGEQALFPPGSNPAESCQDCHIYNEDHHPVNFVQNKPLGRIFPLYQGKVTCLTCHEIHGGDRHQGSPKLLRGGPYKDRRAICFDCHTREQYAEINPHVMQDSKGDIRQLNGKPVCLFCHQVKPDPTEDRASNVYFRADIGFLCWRCHPPMPGVFHDQHFLVTLDNETMATLNREEVQEKFTLPLVPRGRINCSTCHNPHQAGVILYPPAAAGAGAAKKLRDPNICAACHKF